MPARSEAWATRLRRGKTTATVPSVPHSSPRDRRPRCPLAENRGEWGRLFRGGVKSRNANVWPAPQGPQGPQGLKPASFVRSGGTAEAMPFPNLFKQQRNGPTQAKGRLEWATRPEIKSLGPPAERPHFSQRTREMRHPAVADFSVIVSSIEAQHFLI
jgi:hypothetical protein